MDLGQFESKLEEWGKTEEGTVRAFLIGVLEFLKDDELGLDMISKVLPKTELDSGGRPGSSTMFLLNQFKKSADIAASYLGGSPDNSYEFSYDNEVVVNDQNTRRGDKETKLFVQSGGKDSASPVTLKKNKHGYWKIFEFSSLATGVKKIADDDF